MDLIRSTLEAIQKRLNSYLSNIENRPDDWVTLTSLVGHDGSVNENAKNKVVMSVYSITNETTISTYAATQPGVNQYYTVNPPIYIDLYLILLANFTENQYATGLGAISRVISFFQQSPALTHANCPDLPPQTEKITLEFVNINPVEINYIMGMLGTKYLPSVFYKLRMLPFNGDTTMTARSYAVQGGGIYEKAPGAGG